MGQKIAALASGLDYFAFIPQFRVSQKQRGQSTLPGLASTLAVTIMAIMFIAIQYNVLVGHIGTNFQQVITQGGVDALATWPFTIGQHEEATGYGMKLAFGVYNASDFKPPADLERLGTVKAYAMKMTTNADGGIVQEKVSLKTHKCNMQDIDLFNMLGAYQSKISLFNCMDAGQKIDFVGDYQQDSQTLLVIDFQKCNERDLQMTPGYSKNSTCMNKTESKKVMENMGAYMIYSTQDYQPTVFDQNTVVKDVAKQFFLTGNQDVTQEISFLIHRSRLALNDNQILNLLGQTYQREFIEVGPAPDQILFSWVKQESHMRMYFSLDLDVVTYERNAYTLAQLLSDAGGFLISLVIICNLCLKQILQLEVSLENKLMNNVFRRRVTDSQNLAYINVNYRQYLVAVLSSYFCLRRPRHELWRRVAMRRMNREMDMSLFLRKQLMQNGLFKSMTTLGQRALLQRQYSLVMPGAHDGATTTQTDSDYDFTNYTPTTQLDHVLVNRLRKDSRNSMEPVDKLQVDQILNKTSKNKKKKIVQEGQSGHMQLNKNNTTEMSQNFLLGVGQKEMFGDSQINGNFIEDDFRSESQVMPLQTDKSPPMRSQSSIQPKTSSKTLQSSRKAMTTSSVQQIEADSIVTEELEKQFKDEKPNYSQKTDQLTRNKAKQLSQTTYSINPSILKQ